MAVEKSFQSIKNQQPLKMVSDFYTGLNWTITEKNAQSDEYEIGSQRTLKLSGRVY